MAQTGSNEPDLDAEELMRLALKAMTQNRDDEALRLLKHAIVQEPGEARLHYLLGALHAELGMVERAIQEITRATQLNPELGIAHFQLGLLHMARAQFEPAKDAWQPLDQLGEDDPLRLFKEGMVQFLDENYEQAVALLKRGIALEEGGGALTDRMERVIERAQAAMAEQDPKEATRPAEPVTDAKPDKQTGAELPQHVLLSGYRKQGDKPQ
jgi:tetratricopeptide (TPR) repeat protein